MLKNSWTAALSSTQSLINVRITHFFHTIREATGGKASLRWLGRDKITEAASTHGLLFPLSAGLYQVDAERARRCGLVIRSKKETVQETLEWMKGLEVAAEGPAKLGVTLGMEATKEEELLRRYFDEKL